MSAISKGKAAIGRMLPSISALSQKARRRLHDLAEFRGESPERTAAWLLDQMLREAGGKALKEKTDDPREKDLASAAFLLRLSPRAQSKLGRIAELRDELPLLAAQCVARNAIRAAPRSIRDDEFVTDLDVVETELVNFFLARIKLANGREFYTFPSRAKFIRLYDLFRDRVSDAFSAETYVLGSDVINRYYWRGAYHSWLPGPGGVIVEAGAYTGFKAIRFADIVGSAGRVVAIEIDRDNYELMVRNIEANDLQSVITPVWCGVWSEKGEAENKYMGRSRHTLAQTDQHTYQDRNVVPTNTLDNIFDDAELGVVDYLNVQVNGAEVEALDGLKRRFDDVKVFRIASYYSHGETAKADVVCDLLRDRGCEIISRSDVGSITAVGPKFRDQINERRNGFREESGA